MRLDGRRRSTNVDDRRGQGGSLGAAGNLLGLIAGMAAMRRSGGGGGGNGRGGCGCGGVSGIVIIVVIIAALFMFRGCDGGMGNILGQFMGGGITQTGQTTTASSEDEELADFSKQILAGTEDVWTKIFEENGLTYRAPTLVFFDGTTTSGCGNASSSTGPFYCSADESLYIDLSFFRNMRRDLGADGDFAYAYVIAHEIGHHVQKLLGTLDKAHELMTQQSSTQANQTSVRLELQADFYAGVWAYHDNQMFNSIEDGDVEEALDAAAKIGDDYLQRKAQGYTVPESFNHGTSQQRSRWLRLGLNTGDPSRGDTFSPAYSDL